MELTEFVAIVQKLRDAQRAYFRTRSSKALLDDAKRWERTVDQELERFRLSERSGVLFARGKDDAPR